MAQHESHSFQVGVTVIAWEYERQRKKDLDKKAKEDAFRQQLDQRARDERKVCWQADHQASPISSLSQCIALAQAGPLLSLFPLAQQ